MPRGTTLTDQANIERRLWDLLDAQPQAVLDMARPETVTVVSGAVSSFADTTGRYIVTQSTSANRPTYTTNALNGKPVATGNGSGMRLTTAATTGLLNNAPGVTMYVIARATADTIATSRSLVFITSGTGPARLSLASTQAAGTGYSSLIRRLDADTSLILASGLTSGFSEFRTVAIRFDALSTTNNATISENGVNTATGTRSGSAGNISATNPTLFAILGDSGSANTGPYAFAAGAIYHAAHPPWLQQKIEGNMAQARGIANSLVLGHPYQFRPVLRGPG